MLFRSRPSGRIAPEFFCLSLFCRRFFHGFGRGLFVPGRDAFDVMAIGRSGGGIFSLGMLGGWDGRFVSLVDRVGALHVVVRCGAFVPLAVPRHAVSLDQNRPSCRGGGSRLVFAVPLRCGMEL